jgi:hypothetical protein
MGYNLYFDGNKLCNNLKLLVSRKFICACPDYNHEEKLGDFLKAELS